MTVWSYPYEGEEHGDPSVDDRWRKTLNRQASAAGFPLAGVPERVQTPIDRYLSRPPLVSVDELLADITVNGA